MRPGETSVRTRQLTSLASEGRLPLGKFRMSARRLALTGATGAIVAGGFALAAPADAADGWAGVRACESGGDYSINSGNGYYGAYQFDLATWHGLGYSGLPSGASPATQDQAAAKLYAARGAQPWPVCGRYLNGSAVGVSTSAATGSSSSSRYHSAPQASTHPTTQRTATHHSVRATPWITVSTVRQVRTDVRAWQLRMRSLGYPIVVDGWYGPQSAAVCNHFERDHGLIVDNPGILGPQVWSHSMG
jgi:hypothetical protein